MNTLSPSERLSRRLIAGFALTGGVGALIAILLRVFDQWWPWASLLKSYYGMAPHTATLFVLLNSALFVHNQCPGSRRSRVWGSLVVGITGGLGLVVLARRWFSINVEFETWLAGLLIPTLKATVGRMSPHTAMTFTLAAAALGCLLHAGKNAGWWRRAAFLCSAVAFGSGVLSMLGHALGTPLLYGPRFTSMKYVAAGIFLLLNLGLMLAAFPRNWLLQGLTRESIDAASERSVEYRRVLALILVFLTCGIVIAGFYFLRKEQINLRSRVEHELEAVADLTAARVADWRSRYLTEANLVMNTPYASRRAMETLSAPRSVWNRRVFTNWLHSFMATGPYKEAVLLDKQLNISLVLPQRTNISLSDVELAAAERAQRTHDAAMTDLHRSIENNQDIHISLTVPLLVQANETTRNTSQGYVTQMGDLASVGVLVLRIDARTTLFPLVQSWPTSSKTAEACLVRSEGNEGLYLSDLRYETNAALRMRFPIGPAPVDPIVPGAIDNDRVINGLDYRNVQVLAAIRRISNSTWALMVKMDEKEIYAPVRERARALSTIVVVLMLGAVLGLNLAWRQRDNHFLRQQMATEHERFILAQRLAHLMKHANDIIVLTDDQWQILEVNDRGLSQYNYTLTEMHQMRIPDLRTAQARLDFPTLDRELRTHGRAIAQSVHQRKDGSTFPVELSVQEVELDGDSHILAIIRDITDRKQAEQALRDSESRYRSLVETAEDTVFTMTVDGTFTSLNPGFEIATGWMREEWVGKSFIELVHPEDLTLAMDKAARVGSGERSNMFEVRVRKKQGDFLVAQILAAPQLRDGKVDAILGIARDVTVAKGLERSLRESEAKLKLAMEASAMGVWDWDMQNDSVTWSPECYTIFGVTRFDGTFETFTHLVHPEDLPRVISSVNEALEAKAQYAAEFRVTRPDGSTRWLSNLGQASHDEDGRPRRMVGTVMDITARKTAEESLRKSEERYRAVVEDQTEVIARFRTDGVLLFVNDVFCRFFGKTSRELLGSTWHPRALAEDIPMIEAKLRSLSPAHPVEVIENRVHGADGELHWMQFVNRGFFDAQGGLVEVQSVGRDVTERKEAEQQIQSLNASLEQRVLERTAELESANQALREREAQLRLALTASDAATWSWDVKRGVSKWDKRYHTHYRFELDEPVSHEAWLERIHPDDRQRLEDRIRALLESQADTSWNEEFRILHPTKGLRWMAGLGRVERDAHGQATRFAGISLDITHRKEAEEALRFSETRNRLLSERTFEGIAIHENARIIDCNLSFAELFGYKHAELIGSDGLELIAPESRAIVRQHIQNESTEPYEATGLRKDGSTFAMEVVARMIVHEGRKLRFGSCRDITERKRAEENIRQLNESLEQRVRERTAQLEAANEQLSASEARLKQTAEAGNVGLWDWDLSTNRVFFSPEWKRQIGYEDHELPNEFDQWQKRVHPDDLEATLQKVRESIEDPRHNYQVEFRFRHKDGSYRWILAQASVRLGKDGKPQRMLGSHVDITELKRLQEQLLEVSDREQVRIGQDLHDGLSQLLVSAAFDLARLEKRLTPRAPAEASLARHAADSIDTAITEAREVARGLFAVHLGGEGLAQALQDLADNVSARYRIACKVDCPKNVPVQNDTAAIHLYRIAQEAVNNAVKHAHPHRIGIQVAVRDGHIDLTITDDGSGLAPVHDRPIGGMGLHIMDYRARALNGSFKIERASSKGTRVICSVPRQQL